MKKEQFQFIKEVSDYFFKHFNFSVEVCDFIGCQFALESNYGTSKLACNNYNYSGMKKASKRISCQLKQDDDSVFAKYFSPHYCCVDYVLRMQYFSKNLRYFQELPVFKEFLVKSNYCTDDDYVMRIHCIYTEFVRLKNHKPLS